MKKNVPESPGHPIPNPQRIKIVLVEPQVPGNIGSTARAMKNFGLSSLRLVRPCEYKVSETYWLGVHADDVIDAAGVYDTLEDALRDVHWSVATTNRTRFTHFPVHTPVECAAKIRETSPATNVALVFGRERNGLTNEEVHQCHVILTIPTFEASPALNLSHAVAVVLYDVYRAHLDVNPHFEWRYAEPAEVDSLYARIRSVLELAAFRPRTTIDEFLLGVKRILGRTPLENRDVRILHKIFQEIERRLRRGND